MPTLFKKSLYVLIIAGLLVCLGYFWVDKPVAFWSETHQLYKFKLFEWFTYIPNLLDTFVFLFYFIFAIRFCYKKITFHDRALLAAATSLVITNFLKDQFKMIFGRYWPKTWVNNNLSLIHDNAYGFHFFHLGKAYQSFPSGHTALTAAFMVVIWFAYPKLRWLSCLAIALVVIGLIGMNYHFVTDIVAGGVLGGLVAFYVCKISKINI